MRTKPLLINKLAGVSHFIEFATVTNNALWFTFFALTIYLSKGAIFLNKGLPFTSAIFFAIKSKKY